MQLSSKTAYHQLAIEEVVSLLNTSQTQGLSKEEAIRRIKQYGYNEFVKKKKNGFLYKFLTQFKSFMILVLLVAAAISGVIGYLHGEGFTDGAIILAIILLNALIGTLQETKAEKSLDALEKLSAPQCKVIRDGQLSTIESRELVPGDLVLLETGDITPADLRLCEAINLHIQESSLTGESIPQEKNAEILPEGSTQIADRKNMAFSSCILTYGRGKGIVTATGMRTEVGKIAELIQSVPNSQTPLQQKLDKLGKLLGIAALSICLLLFVIGVLYGRDLLDMFMIAVSLAAAAIPEGLPAVSTIVLAVGIQRLVKKNAIIRTLPSVETLGCTSIICSDKTGTLTQNKMSVVEVFIDNHFIQIDPQKDNNVISTFKQFIDIAILANDASSSLLKGERKIFGDPTEQALIEFGISFEQEKAEKEISFPRIGEIPFDSIRKRMTSIHTNPQGEFLFYTKGAFDGLIDKCTQILLNGEIRPLDDAIRNILITANNQMATNALRVLAMAYKKTHELPNNIDSECIENEMIFVGLCGMIDPARPEVKAAIKKCFDAGIRPIMITGDHMITAIAIAKDLGILREGENACNGSDLEQMTDDDLLAQIGTTSVYARVSPEHKVRIVKAFQSSGKVVAMTGDGVNDAPALKLADIGCAMGITGTDVSKEASNMILSDDNFATIVCAVEEGRRIYDNILKAIQFMLSTNIGEILVLFTAIVANWDTPLLPIHILWINLVTDSLPALALSVDPAKQGIMKQNPIRSTEKIMNKSFSIRLLLQGTMIGLLALTAYLIGKEYTQVTAQTMCFAVLAFSQLTHVFNVRSTTQSAFNNLFSNKFLLLSVVGTCFLMLSVLTIPILQTIFHVSDLAPNQWLWVILLSIAPLPIVELGKGIFRLFFQNDATLQNGKTLKSDRDF